MKRMKLSALFLVICLCFGLFSGYACAAEEPADSDGLMEYAVANVGAISLPAGWAMAAGAVEEPLPMTYADFYSGDIAIHISCFGADAYEAAGVPLPADVEEYSTRAGVRQGLPEDAAFTYDDFGSYYTEYTQDGTVTYHVLKQGEDCMGDVILTYPEGTELPEGIYQWMSQAVVDAAAEGLHRYDAEDVGTFYLPEAWEMQTGAVEEPLPQTYADFTSGDITIHSVRFGADAYEAAGVPLPADVEEYSTRDGVRRGLPEDAEFTYDDFGNFYVEFTQDGTVTYHVLKQGEESMGDVILTYPEGTELPEDIYFLLSLAVLA